jgi:hypothetical protein
VQAGGQCATVREGEDAVQDSASVTLARPAQACGRAPAGAANHRRGLAMWLLLVACVAVSGEVIAGISLTFQSVSGSRPVSGAGTTNASLSFGTVSAFGALASGVSRVSTSSSYTISTNVGVEVEKGLLDLLTSRYTLRARLETTNPLIWKVGGVTMSTSYATVATSQSYGSTMARTVAFVVPRSQSAGSVSTRLEFLAIAD